MAIAATLEERNALAEYTQGRLDLSGDGHRHWRGCTRVCGSGVCRTVWAAPAPSLIATGAPAAGEEIDRGCFLAVG